MECFSSLAGVVAWLLVCAAAGILLARSMSFGYLM
jgi:hypothetical protein